MRKYMYPYQQFARQTAIILLAVVFVGNPLASAAPMTQKNLNTLARTSVWLDDSPVEAAACGGDITLTGSDNAEKVYNFLTDEKGLLPHQAAGIMGNIQAESGFEPQRQQDILNRIVPAESFPDPAGSSGWGLVQWTPGSKFISTQSPISKANDLGVQLAFLWQQLEGSGPLPEGEAGRDVKAAPNVEEATYAFMGNRQGGNKSPAGKIYTGYERPSAANQLKTIGDRLAAARGFEALYGSNAPSGSPAAASSTGCGATGGSGTVVGDLALPLDQKWYDQYPDRFLKKHHSGAAADIPMPQGTPVYSITGGTVLRAPINNGYGLGVEIDAGNGVVIKYAHGLDGGQVAGAKKGDTVKPGQLIMSVDTTGQSTGNHLHLEISLGGANGRDVCPQPLLQALYEKKPQPSFDTLPSTGCF